MKKTRKMLRFLMLGLFLVAGCSGELPEVPVQEITQSPQITAAPEPEEPEAEITPDEQGVILNLAGTMTKETYPKVDGSTATLPLSEAVFRMATGESAEVAAKEVVHTKTTNSYHRLYDREVDLLIVYEPAEAIVERMKTEPLCIKPIGLDALVFLANASNPLESLTMEQLVDIYSGKITNWKDVGGFDKDLLAFRRPAGSGSQTLMQKLVMGEVPMTDGDNVFRYSTMSDILEGMLSYNNEDNTLGYSVFYYANNMYFEKDLKLMGVDGVVPSTQTIYDGSYKLTNAFYAVIRPDEPEDSNARKIYDWLTGEAGQQLVLDLGYVPVQMPAGADIADAVTAKQEKMELLAKEPLEEGQYFVFSNPQNMVTDYYYGDITVYDHTWKEVANFYNVSLNHGIQGVYTNRYLPVGQIRQDASGVQKVLYGIYDLLEGAYSIVPSFSGMEMLDVEKGYYAVPPETYSEEEYSWMNWRIIDGTGKVLLPRVEMSDWLMISKFGNGYLEHYYDYSEGNGMLFRYYDEHLNLKKVYGGAFALPDSDEMIAGVDYILLENDGCLVDADGEVILNWATFLTRFGKEDCTEVTTQLYSVSLAEEGNCYPVLYNSMVYLLDAGMNVIRIIENPAIVDSFSQITFFEDFCYYWDAVSGNWVYGTYEGGPLQMANGMAPDGVYTNWGNRGYVMYRNYGDYVAIEEHTPEGEEISFRVNLLENAETVDVSYSEEGYVMVNQDCGEKIQSPYTEIPDLFPVYEKSLYYRGELVAADKGMDLDYLYYTDGETALWVALTGEVVYAESESVFEDYVDAHTLANYTIVKDGEVLYEIDNAYLLSLRNETAFFLKGSYVYAVGYDGTEYIKALHTFLNND